MLSSSFSSFLYYFNHFELTDYMAFIWFLTLAFLFLILGIILLRRYTILGFMIIFTVIVICVAGPFTIKWYLNNALREVKTQISSTKQLNFSDTFIIEGNITNLSKRDFSTCKLYIGIYKFSKNKYKQYINELKPARKYTKNIDKILQKNQTTDFKFVLNDFKISPDVNITALSECYK